MKTRRFPGSAPLLAALLAGLAVWLSAPGSPALRAVSQLPWAQPGRSSAALVIRARSGDQWLPHEPMAVALLKGGDVVVADVDPGQVHRFTPSGRLLGSYGKGSLQYPIGLAVDDDDTVWVADLWQERLFRLDPGSGSLETVPSAPSSYAKPGSLAYANGRFYVGDFGRQQVLVLERDGRLAQVIGEGLGSGPGQFAYPNGLWVNGRGELWVADSSNGRIQVFDAEGRLQRILQPHRLVLPRGIVQDQEGRVHVVDTLNHDLAVLDLAGQIVARHTLDEELTAPNGLAIRGRTLYVADRGNGRVLAWELPDEP